jgi:hypothetical protein
MNYGRQVETGKSLFAANGIWQIAEQRTENGLKKTGNGKYTKCSELGSKLEKWKSRKS